MSNSVDEGDFYRNEPGQKTLMELIPVVNRFANIGTGFQKDYSTKKLHVFCAFLLLQLARDTWIASVVVPGNDDTATPLQLARDTWIAR